MQSRGIKWVLLQRDAAAVCRGAGAADPPLNATHEPPCASPAVRHFSTEAAKATINLRHKQNRKKNVKVGWRLKIRVARIFGGIR